MANQAVLDVKLLRSSSPRGQATHLRHVLESHPGAESAITSQLISLVASDFLPTVVLFIWPSVVNEPHSLVALIQQELCLSAHRAAITRFCRHLCRENTFAKAWEAAGGAMGIAQLAAKLSVNDARFLFNLLGATGRSQVARKERHRVMEELLTLLWDGNAALDSRPLREEYVKILPGCGGAFRLKWQEMKRQLPQRYRIAVHTDHEFFEQHYDERIRHNEKGDWGFMNNVRPLVVHRIEYGLDLLDRFADSETLLGVPPDILLEAVICPLSKRFLSRRRTTNDATLRFWSRVTFCLKERQAFRKEFKSSGQHYTRILDCLVKLWNDSRARAEYTEMLTVILPLLPETAMKGNSLANLIKSVGHVRRYQLLRLVLKHTPGFKFDIGESDSLEHSGLENTVFLWPTDLLFLLPANEAFVLWEKLQRAGKFVGIWGIMVYNQTFLYQSIDLDNEAIADRSIMRALLLYQSQAASPFSVTELDTMRSDLRQEVSRRMNKATQGRLPEIRSKWSVAALSLCVAIGDLELYGETLRWARRFNRDPLTIKNLYDGRSLNISEVTDLVAVLPPLKSTLTVSIEELSSKIQSANEVLQILFDTAIMGTSEPSFKNWDWKEAFDLIHRTICKRIDRVNSFQDQTMISDDLLYEALWRPTSVMLEKMLLKLLGPAGEKFGDAMYSTISRFHVKEPDALRKPTIQFLNHLAEYFDSMWAEIRLRETPALVTADEMWPKGLTLQHLDYSFGLALPYLPYAQSRIEAVVFMDPLKVMQPIQVDEETQLAVGTFIDSWRTALRLYTQMPGPLSKDEQRKERILQAWQQATVALSKDRMAPDEAERFWWPVFDYIGIKKDEVGIVGKANERLEASLPDPEEDMQPTEWNPDPEGDRISQLEKDKRLTPTCLDVLLSRPSHALQSSKIFKAENSVFEQAKCVIPGKPRPSSFWDSLYMEYSKLTGTRADAYVAAGILALNMKYGSDISLLKTPFPSSDEVRIPAVYLDQEFLEREVDKYASGVTGVLDRLKHYVPTGLLVQLGASILESTRKKSEANMPYDVLVWTINMILEGANPTLAIPLIQQFVLENPDASSWHRLLLNAKALIHFRPADAKSFFENFTDAILDKLQEQAERRAKQGPDDESANKGPLVKVTTVKMLAQLLRESSVVDPGLAVELNIRILKRASHIDIRIASVKGLTEAIDNTASPEGRKQIFDALLLYAAPIASSINETQPSTNWDALTSDSELPEIWKSENGTYTTPTIMELILKIGVKKDWEPEEVQTYKELVCTILDASTETYQRWMRLFIQKHGFAVPDDAQLPAIPMFPTALDTLLRVMKSETPAKYVDLAKQYLLLRMNLPSWVSAITEGLRSDPKLVTTKPSQHWRHLWNHDYDQLTSSLFRTICTHLEREDKANGTQRTDSHQSLESFVFEVADCLIKQGNLNIFTNCLNEVSTIKGDNAVWGRIVERINGLRTPAWQADPNRKPAVLPDTLPLKIRMLNLSREAPKPDEAEAIATRCANGVVELLKEIVSSDVPYYNSFLTLQKGLASVQPKALMAVMIGSTPALDDENGVTLVDHLRVELAVHMLDTSWIFRQSAASPHDKDVLKQASKLVIKLSNSSVENFRRLATPLKARIVNPDIWDIWD
ncbi:hypothetical protein V8C35DRAFT_314253 [Trichoderma chlorosporum]